MASAPDQTGAITGLQAHLGEGAPPARGFWADAWAQVLRRPGAVVGLLWISFVGLLAVAAPLIASGHPLVMWQMVSGQREDPSSPLLENLSAVDWLMLIGAVAGLIGLVLPGRATRGQRLGMIIAGAVQAGLTVMLAQAVGAWFGARDAPNWARSVEQQAWFRPAVCAGAALVLVLIFSWIPFVRSRSGRLALLVFVGVVSGLVVWRTWSIPPAQFDYIERERAGQIEAVYTLIPWSPSQRPGDRDARLLPPGASFERALEKILFTGVPLTDAMTGEQLDSVKARVADLPLSEAQLGQLVRVIDAAPAPVTRLGLQRTVAEALDRMGARFLLGTDSIGQDVLSQMIHACRLAISIGLVSTGIAVLIGVTLGALMGYFGGVVDLLLYRVVEVFMAVPLLFILIVAAGVLPRNTYVMMAIIGCFTWTGAARYTRAEFLKLRNQDFVQSARAVGLPLRSILFRHMLPNGVTPVLVDASFAIAFAIILEATLSYLGLGPQDQASWGRLLADATNEAGDFVYWLAIFPGLAIFLAAFSYNLIGEALRDAIDPKLKKARV